MTTSNTRDSVLSALDEVLETRKGESPDTSYVASLYAKGLDKILEKVGEEATETIIAAKNPNPQDLVNETADLWFHSLVLLHDQGLSSKDVAKVLSERFGVGGHEEKANR